MVRQQVWLVAALVLGGLAAARAAPKPPPPDRPPAGFVDLAVVAPAVVIDMRYAGSDNFLGRPARGYSEARSLLTKEAAGALAAIQRELAPFGAGLKVYDCYRPQRAVDDFVAWSRAPGPATDSRHHPDVPKRELIQRGYIAARSGHSRGSTVDLTLISGVPLRAAGTPPLDCRTIDGPRAPDGSLNMGTTFDCFDARAEAESDGVSPEARRNRLLLRMVMEKHGFVRYAQEWWHFTLANEPFPKTAFDFEIRRAP
jgi:D-alanyl-D-alanine dipeptidase